MAYNTTGTTSFNLDLNNLVEEAFERCGQELRSGYDMRTARRSLNILTMEWANRGLNMWTVEQGQIVLATGQSTYALPIDTVDLLDHVVRTGTASNQSDINITRISESTYSSIPNKLANGRPIQLWINRQSGATGSTTFTLVGGITSTDTTITVSNATTLASAGYIKVDSEIIYYSGTTSTTLQNCVRGQANTTAAAHTTGTAIFVPNLPAINVWPTPDAGTTYTFVYWRLRRMQDAGDGLNGQDIPFRFIPCMVAGLAYYLSMKIPGAEMRLPTLQAEYERQFELAATEDREKAADRFVPREQFIGG
jgi:hypothetical protein